MTTTMRNEQQRASVHSRRDAGRAVAASMPALDRDGATHGATLAVLLALALLLAAALLGLPAHVGAWQAPTGSDARLADARWAPFVGCWEPVDALESGAGLLCVRPADEGVEMFTIRDGEIRTSDLLVADGVQRPLRAEGCEGTEAISFSEDGRRAFSRSEYTCDGVSQSGTGLLAVISPAEWVDVRSLEVDGEYTAWVQRYRLVGAERASAEGVADATFGMEAGARMARMVAHRGVAFDQVIEASAAVDDEAVGAWLATRGQGFEPTAGDLERLADAGVAESVVDVVVAVSFPRAFQVNAEGDAERAERDARPADMRRYGTYYGPRAYFGYRMFGYGYAPMDPFFHGYGFGYPGFWGYRPGRVIIERRDQGPLGRLVPGRGYTRDSGEGRPAAPRGGARSGGDPSPSPSASPAPRRSGGEARPAPSSSTTPERRPARPRGSGGG